jgi:large subunit ribosomal protein L25
MITKEITAAVRKTFGKGEMRRLRSSGKTPGVVYRGGDEALPLEFETKTLYTELLDLQGRNAVITLKVDDGSEKSVLVKEIQTDPVKDTLYHTDFLEIDLDKTMRFSVPVKYTGKAKGVELGGSLEVSRTELELEGLPLSIPDNCEINIGEMNIGDKFIASDIALPEGVTLGSKADAVCVHVAAP